MNNMRLLLGHINATCDEKKNWIKLVKDFWFDVDGHRYWIPRGFEFDGASIPRAFWFWVGSPFEPQFWEAALIHDWLYLTHILPRNIADEAFRLALLQAGVGAVRARIMWAAVRSPAGALAYRTDKEDAKYLAELRAMVQTYPNPDAYLI
jgi:hypothetical protein